jgi:hypothetical protein
MTVEELRKKTAERVEQGKGLRELWQSLMPDAVPPAGQFTLWLGLHPFNRMVEAIQATGKKSLWLNGNMSLDHAVRYCSKTANIKRTQEEGPAPTQAQPVVVI